VKSSGSIGYLLVLALCLILAYFTWTGGKERPGEEVTILDYGMRNLERMIVETPSRTVEIAPRRSSFSGDRYYWVTVADAGGEGDVGGGEEEGGGRPAAESGAKKEFKGNDTFDKQMKDMRPLRGLRSFGRLEEEKLEEFGIVGAAERLTLVLKGDPRTFMLGGKSFGDRNRYVQDTGTGDVFMMKEQIIRSLTFPEGRFMEKNLHAFKEGEVERIMISSDAGERELHHISMAAGRHSGWADPGDPEKEKHLYSNWVKKLFRLRLERYLPRGEDGESPPLPSAALTLCELRYYRRAKELGFLTLYKAGDGEEEPTYLARSESTEGMVELAGPPAGEFLEDMADVIAGE